MGPGWEAFRRQDRLTRGHHNPSALAACTDFYGDLLAFAGDRTGTNIRYRYTFRHQSFHFTFGIIRAAASRPLNKAPCTVPG
jgi:hypothetical protein